MPGRSSSRLHICNQGRGRHSLSSDLLSSRCPSALVILRAPLLLSSPEVDTHPLAVAKARSHSGSLVLYLFFLSGSTALPFPFSFVDALCRPKLATITKSNTATERTTDKLTQQDRIKSLAFNPSKRVLDCPCKLCQCPLS